MTSIIINSSTPFGEMTAELVDTFNQLDTLITRLGAAVANAASSFSGTAGTEYEGESTNFGVVASGAAGAQGTAYAYQVNAMAGNWPAFKAANLAYIEALDNGG